MTRDSADDLEPSFKSLGVSKFIYYSILLVLLYNIVFYTMETFNFFNWLQWIKCIVGKQYPYRDSYFGCRKRKVA